MKGYHGKLLEVDLTNRTLRDLSLSEAFCRKYIGGAMMAAALVYDRVSADIDPLSPENPLVMAPGPLTGSPAPMVSRYAVCGISPLTGIWGEATSGGVFPIRLKGAGWDGIIITGKADSPVYLSLADGKAEIRDAAALWGKNSYETQRLIKEELQGNKVSVSCIGRAGEQLIKYASVMNDEGRAAGRCGMGALMGSKNLKAVAASGNRRPEPADKKEINKLAKQAVKDINGDMNAVLIREYGTLGYMDIGMVLGDTPTKYFTKSVFPSNEVSGQTLRQKYAVNNYACRGCPIGCGRELKNYKPDLDVDGPEYETAAAFGPLCMNNDLDSIIEANHLCNVHGIDTISTGVSVAYAMYLFEKGVVTRDQVGFELNWGDGKAVVKLVEMIINQEGIGVLLSKGVRAMAEELGRDKEEAAHTKGLEMPMHDVRAFHGQVVSHATSPRGACHCKGEYFGVELGGAVEEYNILPGDRLSSQGKGESAAKFQSYKDLFNSLTLCNFAPLKVPQICGLLNAQTGWNLGPEELLEAGNRSITIKHALNNKLGLSREQDTMPKICLDALDEGTTAGVEPDMDMMLKEYYQYRKWDWESGKPTPEALSELGLDHIAEEMYPRT
ncbi:aldehyde:ferredoxin oxidoreductase [Desulfocicer vacuolatum DSM 3385]|uniref:Aldehyde:ferredoxin oxidoreductase n=1 Tax=Desulfocicer vacuolatum DSM 3385 TaxID=1121400 RepID=A0A1W2EQG7_9BACT|nr:aldehyde ferredoxin oxidoreductase family protein [Desulfocicer vacuolatum]SMD11782.1 aldehyde:ferredoxin oxidoreductase [Desulfocicer vacuolatum DSM 3385]